MLRKLLTAGALGWGMLSAAALADEHAIQGNALKWAAGPPSLPAGVQVGVLQGDPAKEGLYVIRLKLPAGYRIPAHIPTTSMSPSFRRLPLRPGAEVRRDQGHEARAWRFCPCRQGHGALCVGQRGDHRAGARAGTAGHRLRQPRRRSAQEIASGAAR